jgi:hypothetical protein
MPLPVTVTHDDVSAAVWFVQDDDDSVIVAVVVVWFGNDNAEVLVVAWFGYVLTYTGTSSTSLQLRH